MNYSKTLGLLCSILFITHPLFANPDSARDFFKGKTITYIVATNAGGGYDSYARLIARYMEKQLPDTRIVIRNMPGAGHLIGTNWLYKAKPDGLTIGTFNTGLIYSQLSGRSGIQFDLNRFDWIGKAATDTRVMVSSRENIGNLQDLRTIDQPFLSASSGIGTASHVETTLLARTLGLNIKVIPGYGGNEGEMAVLRGELHGILGSYSSLRPFVENGNGQLLWSIGEVDSETTNLLHEPSVTKNQDARALLDLIQTTSTLSRLTAAPPNTPADRLTVLREAYLAALNSPELQKEARRMRLPIVPESGDVVAAKIKRALQPSESVLQLFATASSTSVAIRSTETALGEVGEKGKRITFDHGGKSISAKVSGSRSQVFINDQKADRADLATGMQCKIDYTAEGKAEVTTMHCQP